MAVKIRVMIFWDMTTSSLVIYLPNYTASHPKNPSGINFVLS
jgi:hypothetical protein